jgi:hypothetical protein
MYICSTILINNLKLSHTNPHNYFLSYIKINILNTFHNHYQNLISINQIYNFLSIYNDYYFQVSKYIQMMFAVNLSQAIYHIFNKFFIFHQKVYNFKFYCNSYLIYSTPVMINTNYISLNRVCIQNNCLLTYINIKVYQSKIICLINHFCIGHNSHLSYHNFDNNSLLHIISLINQIFHCFNNYIVDKYFIGRQFKYINL